MDEVFIYWDNSNISYEAQRLADAQEGSTHARYRIRINFDNLLRLADAGRPIGKTLAAGSVPPELRQLWNRIENRGVEVQLFDRGGPRGWEQDMPDRILKLRMLEDALDYSGDPGIVVLLTGDGAGFIEGSGFRSTLERMHERGWRTEILAWVHSCDRRMREWAERKGAFVPFDEYYDAITFLEPSRPGHEFARARPSARLDLSRRVSAN